MREAQLRNERQETPQQVSNVPEEEAERDEARRLEYPWRRLRRTDAENDLCTFELALPRGGGRRRREDQNHLGEDWEHHADDKTSSYSQPKPAKFSEQSAHGNRLSFAGMFVMQAGDAFSGNLALAHDYEEIDEGAERHGRHECRGQEVVHGRLGSLTVHCRGPLEARWRRDRENGHDLYSTHQPAYRTLGAPVKTNELYKARLQQWPGPS